MGRGTRNHRSKMTNVATGAEYAKWVEENEKLHKDLMAKGGLLPK